VGSRSVWSAVAQVVCGLVLLPVGSELWDACRASSGVMGFLGVSRWWLLISIIALSAPIAITSREKRLIAKGKCTKLIKRLLAGLSDCYPSPNRTNVMLTKKEGNRLRRRVDKATAHNMDEDPDNELEMDAFAGVSGKAMREKAYVWGDLTIAESPGAPSWGLRPDEQRRVRPGLKSIVSVPLIDCDAPGDEPLGTLQIDSDLTIEEFLPDRAAGGKIAFRFADVVALLLKERG